MKNIIRLVVASMITILFCGAAFAGQKKLLHVSMIMENEVNAFIESVGAGSEFAVTQVHLAEFNAGNPAQLNDFDAIVFGVNDAYEPDEYGVERTAELKAYVANGGGIVWAHDTMELKFDLGREVETAAGVNDIGADWVSSAQAEALKNHTMLHFPFQVANPGDVVTIQDTHTTGGVVTTADLILNMFGQAAAPNNFYLTAHEWQGGRVAVNQFGHSASIYNLPSEQETQLFVNSLCWVAGGCGMADASIGIMPSSINPSKNGMITVTIKSSAKFDAATVNPKSVRFGVNGTEAAPAKYALTSSNNKGKSDLVLQFPSKETGIACGTTAGLVTGTTANGTKVVGSKAITTVSCK